MRPIADRLRVWLRLFRSHPGLGFEGVREGALPEHLAEEAGGDWDPRTPAELRDFAAALPHLAFVSQLREGGDYLSAMSLTLRSVAPQPPAWLPEHPGLAGVVAWTEVDCPDDWNGQMTFLAYRATDCLLVWGPETPSVFPDLGTYLTIGARRGFVLGWPAESDDPGDTFVRERTAHLAALRAISLPVETPPDVLRAALVARGATPDEAAELHQWLGADVSLLLPR